MGNVQALSRVVVACNSDLDGCVLWSVGPIRDSIREVNDKNIADMPFEPFDPLVGISVWEGYIRWVPGGYEYPQDGEVEYVGEFRSPTEEEWQAVRDGCCPWVAELNSDDEGEELCDE